MKNQIKRPDEIKRVLFSTLEDQAFCGTQTARRLVRTKKLDLGISRNRLPKSDYDLISDVFFSEEIPDVIIAKKICTMCPIQETCLLGALQRGESYGVWGGQYFTEGQILKGPKRRGRPPKVANPAYEMPEVPLPLSARRFLDEAEKKADETDVRPRAA